MLIINSIINYHDWQISTNLATSLSLLVHNLAHVACTTAMDDDHHLYWLAIAKAWCWCLHDSAAIYHQQPLAWWWL